MMDLQAKNKSIITFISALVSLFSFKEEFLESVLYNEFTFLSLIVFEALPAIL